MDDLKSVFDKIEKAEALLKELDRKRTSVTNENDKREKLKEEHQVTIDSARQTIASIKDKLSKELTAKAVELDKCQEDLATLQVRLKVGEISEEIYSTKSKHLIDKIKSLEKKVLDTQSIINTRFAEDIAPVLKSEEIVAHVEPAVELKATLEKTPDNSISQETAPVSLAKPEMTPETVVAQETGQEKVSETLATQEAGAEKIPDTLAAQENGTEKVPVNLVTREIAAQETPQAGEELAKEATATGKYLELNGSGADVCQSSEPSAIHNVSEEMKQETGEGDTAKAEVKKEEPAKIHKPSLHLHQLHDTAPDTLHTRLPQDGSKNRVLIVVIAAFVIGLIIWGGIALFAPRGGSNVGEVAPDFVMQLSDDSTSALSSFRGKTVLIVFWDRDFWDGQFFYVNGVQRRLYTPDKLNQLYNIYPRSELAIIAITSGTSNNEIDKLIHDYDVKFPVIVDSFGKLRNSYNISYEPTYIFVDKDGVIRSRVEGPITTMSELEQYIYDTSKNIQITPAKPPIREVIIQQVTEKSASINWTTEKPATTQVDIDGKNIQTVITPSPQTLHSLELRDLEPDTAYHVRIVYNVDNVNVSEHSFGALYDTIVSKKYVITTANKDTSNPEISNISKSFITDSSVTITWKTDEPASGEVDYSIDKSFLDTATQNNKLSIWHTVKVDGLKPDTTYNLKLRSRDASGKETSQEIEPTKTQNLVEIAPKIGKRAPDFTLYTIDGTNFTLSQFLGHPVLLNFWLEGCLACEAEMPIIQTAYDKYSRDQLIILAVNVRGDPDKVGFYIAKEGFTFPVLIDTEGDVDDIYRAPYFPTSYFIDSMGIIQDIAGERFQTISQIDDFVNKLK